MELVVAALVCVLSFAFAPGGLDSMPLLKHALRSRQPAARSYLQRLFMSTVVLSPSILRTYLRIRFSACLHHYRTPSKQDESIGSMTSDGVERSGGKRWILGWGGVSGFSLKRGYAVPFQLMRVVLVLLGSTSVREVKTSMKACMHKRRIFRKGLSGSDRMRVLEGKKERRKRGGRRRRGKRG